MAEYSSVEALIESEVASAGRSVHLECSRDTVRRARAAVEAVQGNRRGAYFLESDGGFDRDTVESYLRFFGRISGSGRKDVAAALAHFGLENCARTLVSKLTAERKALLGFARMSLFEPEICFCERPLLELGPEARSWVLSWIADRTDAGTVFVTAGQPLREALLMPGGAFWEEEGRIFSADLGGDGGTTDDASESAETDLLGDDEVRICKIAVKAGEATLLLDPREIDFVESANRVNYASVRGELYPTALTMDELEETLARYGFFRCHRSYIVNMQKVSRVERYTRNTFNLVLSDAAHTSLPLSKGRAEEMRERFRWK
uniref:LytR family transcriptional regulator n=1 Tax=Muribaculaceae bacterium Z82 TaxID=2304548 RepID=A0A7C9JCQ2_9BACT